MANGNGVMNNSNVGAGVMDDSSDNSFAQVMDSNGNPVSDPIAEARKRFPDQLKDKSDQEIYSNFAEPGAKNSYQKLRAAFPDETKDMSPDQLQKWMSRVAEVKPDYNPPGFVSRTAETSPLGTAHPVSDTYGRLKQLVTDPGQFASDAYQSGKNFVYGLDAFGRNLMTHPLSAVEDLVPGDAEFRQDMAKKNYRGAAGDITGGAISDAAMALTGGASAPTSVEEASQLALRGTPRVGVPASVEGAQAASKLLRPTGAASKVVAGTTFPLSRGQALTEANPTGAGPMIKGVEDITKGLPGGKPLRDIDTAQQAGARQVLADVAGRAGAGEAASAAPDEIEANWTNAIANQKAKAQSLYNQVAQADQAANKPDLMPVTQTAVAILDDDTIAPFLTGKAKNALSAIAGGATDEADMVSQQIFGNGKTYAKLLPDQQAEVQKALGYSPEISVKGALDARSQLSKAADAATDLNAKRVLNHAVGQLDDAIDFSLDNFDAANGTNLKATRNQANTLWSQQSALKKFRDRLQVVMRGQPSKGNRQIAGSPFQKLINELDPPGGREGRTTLMKMFPGDQQSIKDMHALADFMGTNQGKAGGGFAGLIGRLKLLAIPLGIVTGHPGATGGFLASSAGFSYLMAKPGVARALLDFAQAAPGSRRAMIAAQQIERIAQQSQKELSAASVPSMIRDAAGTESSGLPIMIKGAVAAHNAKTDNSPLPLHVNKQTGAFAHYVPGKGWVNSITGEPWKDEQ